MVIGMASSDTRNVSRVTTSNMNFSCSLIGKSGCEPALFVELHDDETDSDDSGAMRGTDCVVIAFMLVDGCSNVGAGVLHSKKLHFSVLQMEYQRPNGNSKTKYH